jgi:endonuclease-3 related protein
VQEPLAEIYDRMSAALGPQHWWPAKSPTEVVIGAILTQNTAWTNVQRAIANLKRARCLNWGALRDISHGRLARLIRPSGTYRVKADRLKTFVDVLWNGYGGSLRRLLNGPLDEVRLRLLEIRGVGPETADAILLYAGNRPVFVVDAYTKRILRRHFLIDEGAGYDDVQQLFDSAIPPDVKVYNEYHALLVAVGKRFCRNKARCEGCPLAGLPHDGGL